MTERGFLFGLGLLCTASIVTVVVGCSSSDDSKSGTASGGSSSTVGGSTGNAQGGKTASGGRTSGSSGGGATASGGTSASGGGATASGGTSASGGGATASGGAGASGGGATASGGAGACTPDLACKPVAPNTGDPYADCFARVNQFRACDCKPPLTQDKDGQACADQQAAYDAMQNSAHAGFGANICKPQFFAQNECPGWGSQQDTIDGCAQQMYDEGPGPTDPCDGACYSAHGHFINMTGNYKMVTCGFATDSKGKIWTVQNFR